MICLEIAVRDDREALMSYADLIRVCQDLGLAMTVPTGRPHLIDGKLMLSVDGRERWLERVIERLSGEWRIKKS